MWVTASILATLLFALVAPPLHNFAPRTSRVVTPLVPLTLCILFATLAPHALARPLFFAHDWAPQVGLVFSYRLDGLSLLFALLITGIGTLVFFYAGFYLEGHRHLGRLYAFLCLFMAAMLGLVLADNGILLFVFWELTSFSSYLLIGFNHEKDEARSSALTALLVTGMGGLALLASVVILAQATGTYELSQMTLKKEELVAHPLFTPILILVLLAALTKSAQFPFHFWLPRAMAAPTPVSTYLHAATMVKAGIYLLARTTPLFSGSAAWHQTLTWVGAITALVGAILSLGQSHLKRILAYSTVSALGLMVLLIGVGTPLAILALVAFLVAHACYKGSLFLIAGTVDHQVHESNVEKLGGLRTSLPYTTLAAVLAGLSMAGVPPLFGFVSKESLYNATLGTTSRAVTTACAVAVSALFLVVALRVGFRPFFAGELRAERPKEEAHWPLWATPMVLSGFGILLGVFPNAAAPLINSAMLTVNAKSTPVELSLWHGVTIALVLSVLTLALGFVVYRARPYLVRLVAPLAPVLTVGPDRGYLHFMKALTWLATAQTRVLQSGYLRSYILIIISTTVLAVGYSLWGRAAVPALPALGAVRLYEGIIVSLILISVLAALTADSRSAVVLALGVVGLGVSLIFLHFGAPDLGITQLVVETLTVVLLVIAFAHLPRLNKLSSQKSRTRDAVMAVAFGGLMATLALVASSTEGAGQASAYFSRESLPQGHGRNVVNVILTDFRALDTLGEIAVLAVAAFGLMAVLKLPTRLRSGGSQ